MIYDVCHRTRFRYASPVSFSRCTLRPKPIDWDGQSLRDHALTITPAASLGPGRSNGYLVNLTRMLLDRPASEVVIESRFRVEVERPTPAIQPADPSVAQVAALARASFDLGASGPANYLFASPRIALDSAIAGWCAEELMPDRGIVDAGFALACRIRREFRYDGAATLIETSPSEAFEKRHGVCQDFAQIMIAGLRGAGVPAAYVSGYIRTAPAAGMPRLVGADATHAWVLIWCGPERGWIGFDPTNASMMANDHVVTGIGRDYADVAPIDGIFLGRGAQTIDVSVDVAPVS